MPGLQSTFLAMDTEEGVEVVWNELQFMDKAAFTAHEVSGIRRRSGACAQSARLGWPWQRLPSPEVPLAQQEKIKATFEQLVVVDHPNIVKVHKYWLDVKESKAQVS